MSKYDWIPPPRNPDEPFVPPPPDFVEKQRQRIAERLREENEAQRKRDAEAKQERDKQRQVEEELIAHRSLSPAPVDALQHAAADGHQGKNWKTDSQQLVRLHRTPGALHHSEIRVLPDEQEIGMGAVDLERLTNNQDADCIFVLMHVANVLLQSPRARGWFDLNDLIERVGWSPRSEKAGEQYRSRIFQYLKFGLRTRVIESGSIYYDKRTRKQILTQIESPFLMLGSIQRPEQMSLSPSDEVPMRIELALPDVWIPILQTPQMQQYLRCLQLLTEIPGQQPSGAWARCIGLGLAFNWRHGDETPATRRHLLFAYTPKVQPPEKLLASDNPKRVRIYWCEALRRLDQKGIILKPREEIPEKEEWHCKNDREEWFDARITIHPGRRIRHEQHE